MTPVSHPPEAHIPGQSAVFLDRDVHMQTETAPVVSIVMGSKSDLETLKEARRTHGTS
jgi:hypothetical protein